MASGNGRHFKTLRLALNEGRIDVAIGMVKAGLDRELMSGIREQKLLLRLSEADQAAFANALISAARTRLSPDQATEIANYVGFCSCVRDVRDRLGKQLATFLAQMPRLTLPVLLQVATKVFRTLIRISNASRGEMPDLPTVGAQEKHAHDLNGNLSDFAYAVLRAMNEASRTVLIDRIKVSPVARSKAERLLTRATYVASALNGIEWLYDQVSYGEMSVRSLSDSPHLTVTLDWTDPRHTLIRTLAIRRKLVRNMGRLRPERLVRNNLQAAQDGMIDVAVSHYQALAGHHEIRAEAMEAARDLADAILVVVDAEDDLLFGAAGDSSAVSATYFASMALRWYMLGADVVRRSAPPRLAKQLDPTPIPLDALPEGVIGHEGQAAVASALEGLSLSLPARGHFDLVRRPFVRTASGMAYPVLTGDFGVWNTVVRETLIAGGLVGKRIGKVWELWFAEAFKGSDWTVIGEGVRLRRAGTILTDVDLLLLRDDLLLVVQIKGLIGSGLNPYDHWKNRKIIEKGCHQARIATDHLRANRSIIAALAGKRVERAIQFVEPLVLTNLGHFDGCVFDDVPVMGESGRNAIIDGSRITYTDSENREVGRHEFVAKEALDTAAIRELLGNSIELQVAAEIPEVVHVDAEIAGITWRRPEFRVDEARERFDVIADLLTVNQSNTPEGGSNVLEI